ncbi:MAG: hypothetical protein ACLTQI_03305 [Slackia sp.]
MRTIAIRWSMREEHQAVGLRCPPREGGRSRAIRTTRGTVVSPSAPMRERRYSDRLSGSGSRHEARPSRRSSDGFDNALFDDIDASIAPPKETTNRIGAVHVGSYNAYGQGLSQRNARRSADQTRRIEPVDSHRHDPHSTHRARRSTMPGEHYTNLYAAPKNIGVRPPSWRDKIPFIIAGVIILLLVILIAVIANGMGRAETTDNQPAPMNVTGLPGSSRRRRSRRIPNSKTNRRRTLRKARTRASNLLPTRRSLPPRRLWRMRFPTA